MLRVFKDRNFLAGAALVLVLVLLVAVNVLVSALFPAARLDLTQEKLYTLSGGTRQLLRQIDEPITLRFYLSDRLVREVPAYGAYATRVRDLLGEYASAAGGKLRLESYNPQPFSDVEDRAVAQGLQGVPVDQTGELIYFGLAGSNTTDDEEVIAFFQPERERFLEYDLTRMVYNLARPKRRVIGMISTLPIEGDMMAQMRGQPPEPWMVLEQMRQFFEVRTLGTDLAVIPPEVDVLMLIHPAGLSDKTQYAIEQFVLKGGKAMVMVDPHSEAAAFRGQAAAMRGMPGAPPASELDKLMGAWGVRLASQVVVGDRRLARRVSAGPGTRMQAADYLAWISVPGDNMNRDDAVTGQLQLVNFASAGILEQTEGAQTSFAPLIQSSAQSMRLAVDKVKGTPDILGILRGFRTEGKALTVAARVSGPAKSVFEAPPEGSEVKDPVKEGTVNAILVADTDLLEDRFWVQVQQFFGQRMAMPSANNADFVVNSLDNLTGSDALIGLRSRGISERPFTLVREIQQNAESQFRTKEQELQDKVKETEKKLADLRTGQGQAAQGMLTPEQAKAIEGFRGELLQTRGELRDVQRSMREDIEGLQNSIRFINIGLVPLLVALVAVVLGVLRILRRRRRVSEPATA